MKKDLLLDGIIKYTLEGYLKWVVSSEKFMAKIVVFKSKLEITKNKELVLDFYCDYTSNRKCYIIVWFSNKRIMSGHQRLGGEEISSFNRFKELSMIIDRKLERII